MDNPNTHDVLVTEKYQLSGRISAPEYYVDGVSQMFLGYPITKTLFHAVTYPGNGGRKEQRRAVQLLTMPTVQAIEYANLILTAAKKSEPQLLDDLTPRDRKKLVQILERFQLNEKEASELNSLPSGAANTPPKTRRVKSLKNKEIL